MFHLMWWMFANLLNGLIIVGASALAFTAGLNAYMLKPVTLSNDLTVQIKQGYGIIQVANLLEQKGVIDNAEHFAIAMRVLKPNLQIKAGEYRLNPEMSAQSIALQFNNGSNIRYKVTIPEGWTVSQAINRIESIEILTGEIKIIPAEGTLLPGTYFYFRGMKRQKLVDSINQHHKRAIAHAWNLRDKNSPLQNKQELLILASIVEKETQLAHERDKVARAFINRLKLGMKLQADPTVIYGITLGKEKFARPITRSDLRNNNAYNTYVIKGLPPTPIANPSKEVLIATADPDEGKQLFFVADGSGGHVFANTYSEHKKNVALYRKLQKQNAKARQNQ